MKVVIYGAEWCPYCREAKKLCAYKDVEHTWLDIDTDEDAKRYVKEELNVSTIPQILVDGELIGGYTELLAYFDKEGV